MDHSPVSAAGPAYPLARAAAAAIHRQVAGHLAFALGQGQGALAPEPPVEAIEAIVEAAFWAGLRREEGRSATISLAFVPPDSSGVHLTLDQPLPLSPEPMTRLAPAVERPGIHLGVWRDDSGELLVWGATRTLPQLCFVVEVVAPGLLVAKQSRVEDSGKYVNIAVFEGDQVKILDPHAAERPGSPLLLKSLVGLDAGGSAHDAGTVFIQLAVSMRAHSHGGALLIVPPGSSAWRESMVQPIRYSVVPPFSRLAELVRRPQGRHDRLWQDAVRFAVDGIAGLTAVDGAAVITQEFELLAFGATIVNRSGSDEIAHAVLTEPVEGSIPRVVAAAELGGTRHLSAAQFVHDQHDAAALVASQDGRFTIFAWSDERAMVQAYRIEALLL